LNLNFGILARKFLNFKLPKTFANRGWSFWLSHELRVFRLGKERLEPKMPIL